MSFQFMKFIDYWVGIPVCIFLTAVKNILDVLWPKKTKSKTPDKILLIKPSEMGAIILAYPLMKQLQTKYPDAKLYFLTFEDNRSLFDVLDIVPRENVYTLRNSNFMMFAGDVFSMIMRLRKEKFDVVIDLEFFSRFTAILSYFSGAPKRVGFYRFAMEGVRRGNLFTHNIQYNPHLHISQMYMAMALSMDQQHKATPQLNESVFDRQIPLKQFTPTEKQINDVTAKLANWGIKDSGPIYLISPGEGRIPLREWPLENFNHLAAEILKDENNCVLIIGVGDAAGKAEQLLQACDHTKRVVNLIGKTTVLDLLTLFTLSRALVLNDCGLAHLASLTSIRQFVLFGPETPKIFSAIGDNTHVFYKRLACSPCLSVYNHRNSACKDNQCLKKINPTEVYQAIFS